MKEESSRSLEGQTTTTTTAATPATRPFRAPYGTDGRRIARALRAAAGDAARPPHLSAEQYARMTGALAWNDTIMQAGDWQRRTDPTERRPATMPGETTIAWADG